MAQYKIHLRYVYTFYSFGEILEEDAFDEFVELKDSPCRFTLHDQEDGSFILSEIKEDYIGKFVTVTFPNKDNIIVRKNEESELAYDEYFDSMGDDNHNVYEGTISLENS